MLLKFTLLLLLYLFGAKGDHNNDLNNRNQHFGKRQLLTELEQFQICQNSQRESDQPSYSEIKETRQGVYGVRGQNRLIKALETGDWAEYSGSLVRVYIGFLLVTLFVIFLFIIEWIQILCKKCCTCLSRDGAKEPYSLYAIYVIIFIAFSSIIILFGFSIAGIQLNKLLLPALHKGECQILNTVEQMITGSGGNEWHGVEEIPTQIQGLKDEFDKSRSIFAQNFANSEFLQTVEELLLFTQSQIYLLKEYQVKVPNPERANPQQLPPDIIFVIKYQFYFQKRPAFFIFSYVLIYKPFC